MATKSKILVLGGTGYIGKFIVKASAEAGHPTFALVRESSVSHPEKSKLIESFKSSGVTLGDLTDHETLVKAIKQVDVVISTVGGAQSPFPENLMLALVHSMAVKGDCTNYELDPSSDVEASQLYPEVKYTTVSHYLDQLV